MPEIVAGVSEPEMTSQQTPATGKKQAAKRPRGAKTGPGNAGNGTAGASGAASSSAATYEMPGTSLKRRFQQSVDPDNTQFFIEADSASLMRRIVDVLLMQVNEINFEIQEDAIQIIGTFVRSFYVFHIAWSERRTLHPKMYEYCSRAMSGKRNRCVFVLRYPYSESGSYKI